MANDKPSTGELPQMKTMKIGDEVIYHEDGGVCRCRLVQYAIDAKEESATVLILSIINQPNIGMYELGEEFSVMHRIDCGAWGGDWFIERVEDSPYYLREATHGK